VLRLTHQNYLPFTGKYLGFLCVCVLVAVAVAVAAAV
jgi:hypothetical protein